MGITKCFCVFVLLLLLLFFVLFFFYHACTVYLIQTILHPNGVWSLTVLPVESMVVNSNNINYTQIMYTLILKRQSYFYEVNILFPSVLLAILNCLVFLLPPGSGERISFAIANLLAIILFQQLVSTVMPPLGDDWSYLGKFFSHKKLNRYVKGTGVLVGGGGAQ